MRSSCGALYRTEPAHREACWIRLPEDGDREAHERRILAGLAIIADVGQVERHEGLLRVELSTDADPATIRTAVEGGSRTWRSSASDTSSSS